MVRCLSIGVLLMTFSSPLAASPPAWDGPQEKPGAEASDFPVLEGVETTLLYDVTQPADGLYNHHPAIATFGEMVVVTWSNHLEGHATGGEEGPGQKVKYRLSLDGGKRWSPPADLFPSRDRHGEAFAAGRVVTANGFARAGGGLYAIAEVADNEAKDHGEVRVRTGLGRIARRIGAGGALGEIFWLRGEPPEPKPGFEPFNDPGRDPALAPTVEAIHAYLARPLNQPAWDFLARNDTPLETGDGEDMVEPSTYRRPDGSLVRLWRDGGRRGFLYAQWSTDGGRTWAEPEQTNIPDSPSKTVSGTLPDGRVYMVGNQVNEKLYDRDPLTLAISRDGSRFDRAWAIRHDAPPVAFKGKGKGPGFQYPAVAFLGHEMLVVYSVGKEDIAISRFEVPPPAGAGD